MEDKNINNEGQVEEPENAVWAEYKKQQKEQEEEEDYYDELREENNRLRFAPTNQEEQNSVDDLLKEALKLAREKGPLDPNDPVIINLKQTGRAHLIPED